MRANRSADTPGSNRAPRCGISALGPARVLFLLGSAWLAGGCATDPFAAAGLPATGAVELAATPFFPQEDYQCGPAALATLLVDAGVSVQPDELVPRIWIPGRRGSLQAEMLGASREYGRLPYVLPPEFPALLAEVAAGRPVLVLQNLGVSLLPAWHYAVVVGYRPAASEIVLRSGTDERRVTDAGVFARTWKRGDNWALVLLRPGEIPAQADSRRYLEAAAAAESAGQLTLAAAAYRAAAERWPDNAIAWLGRGNTAYAAGNSGRAEAMYRRSLELAPGNPAALHNLAVTVAEAGRCDEARALLAAALPNLSGEDEAGAALLRAALRDTACRQESAR